MFLYTFLIIGYTKSLLLDETFRELRGMSFKSYQFHYPYKINVDRKQRRIVT